MEPKIEESIDKIIQEEPKTDTSVEGAEPLSKNQQRKQKWRERYIAKREFKRVEERARRKEKRAALKEAGDFAALRKKRAKKMADSNSKQRIALDMSFDELMSDKDQKRTVQQIGWCYTANRHAPEPFQFHVVGFDGPSRTIYESIEGNDNQDIHLHKTKLEDAFPLSEIVYLTAESENVLTELDDNMVYVIGGIVDHNSQKGLCHRLAIEKKVQHARLPIDEYVHLKTRRVLTINQVYEILVHFSVHKDWEKAFLSIVPERKNPQKKEEANVNMEDPSDNDHPASEQNNQVVVKEDDIPKPSDD